jgi:hypothetical protein
MRKDQDNAFRRKESFVGLLFVAGADAVDHRLRREWNALRHTDANAGG